MVPPRSGTGGRRRHRSIEAIGRLTRMSNKFIGACHHAMCFMNVGAMGEYARRNLVLHQAIPLPLPLKGTRPSTVHIGHAVLRTSSASTAYPRFSERWCRCTLACSRSYLTVHSTNRVVHPSARVRLRSTAATSHSLKNAPLSCSRLESPCVMQTQPKHAGGR